MTVSQAYAKMLGAPTVKPEPKAVTNFHIETMSAVNAVWRSIQEAAGTPRALDGERLSVALYRLAAQALGLAEQLDEQHAASLQETR